MPRKRVTMVLHYEIIYSIDNGKRVKCIRRKMNLTTGWHGNISILNTLSGSHIKGGFNGRWNWKQGDLIRSCCKKPGKRSWGTHLRTPMGSKTRKLRDTLFWHLLNTNCVQNAMGEINYLFQLSLQRFNLLYNHPSKQFPSLWLDTI